MRAFDFALMSTEPESIALELLPMTNDSAERLVNHRTRPATPSLAAHPCCHNTRSHV
jgi:hypothetical protein